MLRDLPSWAGLPAILLAACLATGCTTPLAKGDIVQRLRLVGASVLGPRAPFTAIPIEADSKMAAWVMAADARTGGPDPQSQALSVRFRRGAPKRVRFVVGGPYSSLTRQVLLDALALNGDTSLRGLTLVMVADAKAATEVQPAAERAGVRFHHRQFP